MRSPALPAGRFRGTLAGPIRRWAVIHSKGGRSWCEAQIAKIKELTSDAHQLFVKLKKAVRKGVEGTAHEVEEWQQRRVEEEKQLANVAKALSGLIKSYASARCPALIGVPVPVAAYTEASPVVIHWREWEDVTI